MTAPRAVEVVVTRPPGVRADVGADAVQLFASTRILEGRRPTVRIAGMVHLGEPAYYASVDTFLAPCATVLYEGLEADPAAPEDPDEDLADSLPALGLTLQREALLGDDRWTRADVTAADLRAALAVRPDTTPAQIDDWLVDRDRGKVREALASTDLSDPRLRQVVRLGLIRGLSRSTSEDPGWRDEVIGRRDAVVVDAIERLAPTGSACVVYGAAHLADLEARLVRRGWHVAQRGELPVVTVPLAEVGLGPAQARMWVAPGAQN